MITQANRYTAGESEAHRRAGLQDQAELSRGAIGATVPPVAAAFLSQQRAVYVGATDAAGRTWATALSGPAGFVRAEADDRLRLAAHPAAGDPLADVLAHPSRVGMIAFEPATRRRMRLNGLMRPDGDGLSMSLHQVYANCPKYIQKRTVDADLADTRDEPPVATTTKVLSESQQQWIRTADTFFIATRSREGDTDCSHRGGNPGFIQVASETEIRFPDYVGNAMLMTLGNLLEDPRAGLLLIDWTSGDLLHLSGAATIAWAPAADLPGSQRTVTFQLDTAIEQPQALPLRWSEPSSSTFNPTPTPETR